MEISYIEWCDGTANFWWGCTKVSTGCLNCYADTLSARFGKDIWGSGKAREEHITSAKKIAYKLNEIAGKGWFRECFLPGGERFFRGAMMGLNGQMTKEFKAAHDDWEKSGAGVCRVVQVRPRLFSASMSDWLDPVVPVRWRIEMLDTIRLTPNVDWLLLSKRPNYWRELMEEAIEGILADDGVEPGVGELRETANWIRAWLEGVAPHNVWMGTSVEDQDRADERIPGLLEIPAVVRFLSCEPLLGPVDFSKVPGFNRLSLIDEIRRMWVIVGGESGSGARPMHPDWARGIRNQCEAAGVPFLFKQWGEYRPAKVGETDGQERFVYVNGEMSAAMWRVGKKEAGRVLDGQIYDGYPVG